MIASVLRVRYSWSGTIEKMCDAGKLFLFCGCLYRFAYVVMVF